MSQAPLEEQIRTLLKDELMVSDAEFAELDDELGLDSLTQTELRIALQNQYDIDISPEALPVAAMTSLGSLLTHIQTSTPAKESE